MAKHRVASRKKARRHASRARNMLPPVLFTGAVVATVAAVGGVAVAKPDMVASTMYDLTALIVEGSSTNPTGAGIEDFYRGQFRQEEDTATVNFLTGPFGVYDALVANADDDDNVVMSSGWGAANVSLLLSYLDATGNPDAVPGDAVYVLDNNVARPNGGFGTRYPVFGLIGVNPLPTPTSPGVPVIDVGYEYDINGNAPAYALNGVAMANSLMAYLDRRLNQDELDLPVTVNDKGEVVVRPGCEVRCQTADGWVRVEQTGDTTYVSYEADDLPLTRPLRRYGGEAGARIADAIDPALRAIVDYGYPDNDPLANPGAYKPVGLLPTLRETQTFAEDFTSGVQKGIDSIDRSDEEQSENREALRRAEQEAKKQKREERAVLESLEKGAEKPTTREANSRQAADDDDKGTQDDKGTGVSKNADDSPRPTTVSDDEADGEQPN
jgi:hypothetical protein